MDKNVKESLVKVVKSLFRQCLKEHKLYTVKEFVKNNKDIFFERTCVKLTEEFITEHCIHLVVLNKLGNIVKVRNKNTPFQPQHRDIIVDVEEQPIIKPVKKMTKQGKTRLVKRLLKAYLKVNELPTISNTVKALKNDYMDEAGDKLTKKIFETEYKHLYIKNRKNQITGLK